MKTQIEVKQELSFDTYVGSAQQLLDAGIITRDNLAILDGGKRSLRLFPDGRAWLGKNHCPDECKSPGGKFIRPATKKRLQVWVWVSHEEREKRWASLEQERQDARAREGQARRQGALEEGIKGITELVIEKIQLAKAELALSDEQLVAQRRRMLHEEIAKWEREMRQIVGKMRGELQAIAPPPRLRLVHSDQRAAS